MARHRGGSLYIALALVIFAAVFALGAWSWLQFYRENRDPTGLFTQTDFPAIVIGSRLVASGAGAQLYDLDAQLIEQRQMARAGYLRLPPGESTKLHYPYPYTPFLAVLWSPLVGLSPTTAMAIWDMLNLAAFVVGLWLLLAALPIPQITRLLVVLGAVTSLPFIMNVEQGQSSGVTMLAFGAGIALMKRDRDLPAGLMLGLLAFKVQWLPFLLLVLLWKRRWWALLGVAITGALLMALATFAIGTNWIPGYWEVFQQAQQWSRSLLLDPHYSHSLGGGLVALFGPGAERIVRTLNPLFLLAAAALVLYVWRGPWQPNSARWDGAMALTFLATIFTSLHVNTHDLCLLAIPAALGISYITQSGQSEGVKTAWYASLWAAYLLPSLLLGASFDLPVRLTTLVIGLLIALLAVRLLRRPTDYANGTNS